MSEGSLTEEHRKKSSGFFSHVKTDFPSGVVVFLIALPLCLGISLVSGAPLSAGIISVIIGGIVLGFISDSNIQVSGPAVSLALVVLSAIHTLGSFEIVLSAILLAGVIQLLLGFLRGGTIAYYFPASMIKGVMASIGLILIIHQLPLAFGYTGLGNSAEAGSDTFSAGLSQLFDSIHPGVTLIMLTSLAVIILWERPLLKTRHAVFTFVPGALVAVLVGIGLSLLFNVHFPALALEESHLVQVPVAGSLEEFFSFFSFPDFSQIGNRQVLTVALSIACIASIESLLVTEAGDMLDPYKRITSTNRELKAQGIGNILAGFIGGLPVAAVLVRTSANVYSGGRTRLATITHGALMLIGVVLFPVLLNLIPLACLSALLFVVGFKLASFPLYLQMYRAGIRSFLPFILTILFVLFFDLVTGIVVGGAVALLANSADPDQHPNSSRMKTKVEERTVNSPDQKKVLS